MCSMQPCVPRVRCRRTRVVATAGPHAAAASDHKQLRFQRTPLVPAAWPPPAVQHKLLDRSGLAARWATAPAHEQEERRGVRALCVCSFVMSSSVARAGWRRQKRRRDSFFMSAILRGAGARRRRQNSAQSSVDSTPLAVSVRLLHRARGELLQTTRQPCCPGPAPHEMRSAAAAVRQRARKPAAGRQVAGSSAQSARLVHNDRRASAARGKIAGRARPGGGTLPPCTVVAATPSTQRGTAGKKRCCGCGERRAKLTPSASRGRQASGERDVPGVRLLV
jgi:hypothetical protein